MDMSRGNEILRLKVAPAQASTLATVQAPPAREDTLAATPVIGPDGFVCPLFVAPS